jgi:hypothetical protein
MNNIPDPPRDPWIERRIAELVLEQRVAATMLAAVLAETERRARALFFPLGFPVPGYDTETFASQLRDFQPLDAIDTWESQAREIVQNGET